MHTTLDTYSKKRQIVITGGSKGIGLKIAEAFRDEYEVITVARTSGDFVGDLRDHTFRKRIIAETNPYIFVNNAGSYPTEDNISEMMELNVVAATHFTVEFSKKMRTGFIFNISSLSTFDFSYGGFDAIAYSGSKRLLSDFSQLSHFKNTSVKICCIEPGYVMTDLANLKERYRNQPAGDVLTKRHITPMDPSHIPRVMKWIMSQPNDISISNIRISNR